MAKGVVPYLLSHVIRFLPLHFLRRLLSSHQHRWRHTRGCKEGWRRRLGNVCSTFNQGVLLLPRNKKKLALFLYLRELYQIDSWV